MDKKPTINFVTAGFMLGIAILIDAIQALLTLSVLLIPLSLFLTLVAAILFSFWFFILGAYSGKGAEKKILVSALSTLIEFIPVISIVPAVTAGVLVNILLSKATDLKQQAIPSMRQAQPRRIRSSRAGRTDSARESRESAQRARHTPVQEHEAA